jgi:hypothetical protein
MCDEIKLSYNSEFSYTDCNYAWQMQVLHNLSRSLARLHLQQMDHQTKSMSNRLLKTYGPLIIPAGYGVRAFAVV